MKNYIVYLENGRTGQVQAESLGEAQSIAEDKYGSSVINVAMEGWG